MAESIRSEEPMKPAMTDKALKHSDHYDDDDQHNQQQQQQHNGGQVSTTTTQIEVEADEQRSNKESPPSTGTKTTIETTTETVDGPNSNQLNVDAECDRLLRNAKKQVKQMMEEAVTKKFIHEESSSIISLCVAIDACLSHGLRRRALGLFKTNSSTALINKIAKCCPPAQEILAMVEEEEKRQLADEQQLQKQQQQISNSQHQHQSESHSAVKLHQANHSRSTPLSGQQSSKIILASNLSVHRRNLWIKFALIEKKLVEIVEYLAGNASKYYENDALMANCLSAQIFCSLLVGPCALEFSRSKTNDYYQFEEPNAEELLKRHKLSNPIACLCPQNRIVVVHNHQHHHHSHGDEHQRLTSTGRMHGLNEANMAADDNKQHQQLARSITHSGSSTLASRNTNQLAAASLDRSSSGSQQQAGYQRRRATAGQATLSRNNHRRQQQQQQNRADSPILNCLEQDQSDHLQQEQPDELREPKSPTPPTTGGAGGSLIRTGSRRKPLALKTNVKSGALVTECHHYSCQEISEHQQTRGYSFKCSDDLASPAATISTGDHQLLSNPAAIQQSSGNSQQQQQQQQQQENLLVWSPRMLHEILHQNSKSNLLYAKNNVLLETQSHQLMAGYLSLHQTSSDLILKWIPNQMINGQAAATATTSSATRSTCCCADQSTHENVNCTQQTTKTRRARSEDSDEQRVGDEDGGSNGDNNNNCCQNIDSQAAATTTVGSSYLDLVVSLSVSRIVLLQCQFGQSSHSMASEEEAEREDANDRENTESSMTNNCTGGSSNSYEETLILVEVDGVQRAPFKFPKGGLRWFLSCLENGLFPNKYLDPTICSDQNSTVGNNSNNDSSSSSLINNWLSNPIRSQPPDADQSSQALDSPAAAATATTSRLDSLLRRLPTLKRQPRPQQQPTKEDDSTGQQQFVETTAPSTADSSSSQPNSRTVSPTTKPTASNRQTNPIRAPPINYVFRIVSVQQQPFDWRLQTPPHSAFSVASSSSGSFALINNNNSGSNNNQNDLLIKAKSISDAASCEQQQQQESIRPEQQRLQQQQQQFRWSLSRLTRFSARYSSSTNSKNNQSTCSTSSNSSFGGIMSNFARGTSTNHRTGSTSGSFNWSILDYNRDQHNDSMNNDSLDRISLDPNGLPSTMDSPSAITSSSLNNNNGSNDGQEQQLKRESSREYARIEAKLDDLKKSSSDELVALRNQSIQTLCESMRRQILARAFYGWLAYCRRAKIIRTHLVKLIRVDGDNYLLDNNNNDDLGFSTTSDDECIMEAKAGLTRELWDKLMEANSRKELSESQLACRVNQLVYYGGIENNELRVKVWPYLLGHFKFGDSQEEQSRKNKSVSEAYRLSNSEWIKIERVVKRRDNEILAANMAKVARKNCLINNNRKEGSKSSSLSDDSTAVNHHHPKKRSSTRTMSETGGDVNNTIGDLNSQDSNADGNNNGRHEDGDIDEVEDEYDDGEDEDCEEEEEEEDEEDDEIGNKDAQHGDSELDTKQEEASLDELAAATTTTTNDDGTEANGITTKGQERAGRTTTNKFKDSNARKNCRRRKRRFRLESTGSVGSDASITDRFGNNIHRIDKDVQRCDRNFWYFKDLKNLDKLRNVMCSYVWQHLDVGYVQGMCDLAAPFLVIFDDEILAFTCFNHLMTKMVANFPHGSAMDQHFESLKYLMQVLDPKLFEVLQDNGDYTHFYFCYRWLLLDFKRELAYEDVYRVWETIWSARHVVTDHFVVFLALAMVRYYRDIIIENNMDFTDTIKFFNEMAERHDAKKIIALARDLVVELENLIRA